MKIEIIERFKIPSVTQQEHELAVNRRTGKPYVHDSMEIKQARMTFRAHIAKHAPEKPIEGPVQLCVSWVYHCDKVKEDSQYEYKTTRPDTDNLIKLLKDEMTKCGYWHNDAQVAKELNQKLVTSKDFEGIIVDVFSLPKRVVL